MLLVKEASWSVQTDSIEVSSAQRGNAQTLGVRQSQAARGIALLSFRPGQIPPHRPGNDPDNCLVPSKGRVCILRSRVFYTVETRERGREQCINHLH
jgi:hypothetical protein